MNINEIEQIISKDKIFTNEPMNKYTSFKIGGPAECLIKIQTAEELKEILQVVKEQDIPLTIIGNGSNILVSDEGIKGIVLKIEIPTFELNSETAQLKVGSGVKLAFIAQKCLKQEIAGFEFASGIPGNVGGAVYMNAGAYGGEIKDIICSAEVLSGNMSKQMVCKDDMELSYRSSRFMKTGETILSAEFRLEKGDKNTIKARMDELMEKRISKQPLEYPSAGSTFKRPEGSYASLLIEQCGLKGMAVGDAEVSTKHSGFVVNKGNASFDDLMELIEKVRTEVKEKTGNNHKN